MKVVLDTNVFLSGVFFGGPPFLILQAWRDGKIQLVICPKTLIWQWQDEMLDLLEMPSAVWKKTFENKSDAILINDVKPCSNY